MLIRGSEHQLSGPEVWTYLFNGGQIEYHQLVISLVFGV